ncbi:MAG: D-alanine--D-alanine ligase [Pseudomonadota bacterium]
MSEANHQKYGKVAVLMGGTSGEREISLNSGTAVFNALQKNNIDAHSVDVSKDIFSILIDGNFDRAFIALHGCGGEDGTIQGGLETIGLPYTGSGVMASSICMDKLMTKKVWQAIGIQSPKFMSIKTDTPFEEVKDYLGLPFVIKPSLEGSSLGVHKVNDKDQFLSSVKEASHHKGRLMAEQWVEGKEYTVSILDDSALPVIRLETPHTFYDYDAKYKSNDTQYLLPCGLNKEDEIRLQDQALQAFYSTGASGWGRVDVMLDLKGEPWFLEINTVPGMTDHSLVPMAAASVNIDFNQLVVKILDTSLSMENSHG